MIVAGRKPPRWAVTRIVPGIRVERRATRLPVAGEVPAPQFARRFGIHRRCTKFPFADSTACAPRFQTPLGPPAILKAPWQLSPKLKPTASTRCAPPDPAPTRARPLPASMPSNPALTPAPSSSPAKTPPNSKTSPSITARPPPRGPLEDFLVETLVAADWNRRRYARIEAQLVRLLAASQDPAEENPFGAVLLADAAKGHALDKVFRRLGAAERSYFRALAELRRAQRERLATERDAPPAQPAAGIPEIGFVSPQPATVPNSAPTPAVAAIASAPQNVTRIAPSATPAPPARAANPPRSARNKSEVPETRGSDPPPELWP